MRVNGNFVSLGHSLDCMDRFLEAVSHCLYHWFYEGVLCEKGLV